MQLIDKPLVVGVSPDRNAKVAAVETRKIGSVANEDVALLKSFAQMGTGDAGRGDAHEQKIRFGRIGFEPSKPRKLLYQEAALAANQMQCSLTILQVAQRLSGRRGGQGIDGPRF